MGLLAGSLDAGGVGIYSTRFPEVDWTDREKYIIEPVPNSPIK